MMADPQAPVALARIDERVASLRIATDEKPYLERESIFALADMVERLKTDESVRAVVVEGGARYFSAGGNRATLISSGRDNAYLVQVAEVPRLLLSLPVPTVAAMVGHAIGGGLILGLWCDSVVLAEESLYGANFMALGFTPGLGATMVLEEAVGPLLAREMLFTGRLMKGRELKAAGGPLAHAVVPHAEVRRRAISIAQEMAEAPRAALVLLKETLAARRRAAFDQVIGEEQRMHSLIFAQPETRLWIEQHYATAGAGDSFSQAE